MVEMDNNTSTEKKEHFVGSNTLDSFTNIIQDDKASRINGAVALIKHLSNKKNGEGASKEFQYSLKRLVRGLSASRDTSRIGFFTTLTTYLKLNQETKVDDLIQLMDVELKPNNSNAKSENANIHLGRILLCGALIKSKIVVNSEVVDQLKIVSTLLESGSKRSYLSFYSTSFLVELLNDYDSKTLKANIWPIIKKEIGKNWNEQSLDTLYIIFIMNDKFPKLVNTKFLNEYLDNDNIISIDTIDSLIKIVTDIPRIHYCHHPLYKILCEKLVASNCLDKFWSCIDKKFDKPSKTMEFLSLELLNILVPMINDKSIISSLLSSNFIQYMLKRFNGSKKNRKDVIANLFRKFFSNIVVALNDKELSSKVPIDIIKKLIIYPGDLMIEKITGTKILQMITSNLNDKSIKKLSKVYHEIALNSLPKIINEKQENWINAERLYAGQLLTKLLGHSSVNNEHTWRLEQLKFLFNCGFCEIENIGVELASQYRDMFYRSLDHKLPKLDDLRDVLTKLVDYINDNVIIEKNKILRTPMSDEAIEAWNKMITFIKKPESDFKNKHVVLIFFTMELSMGLHLFFDTELAISSINEIQSCSERLMTKKIINNKKNKKETTTTTNDTINGDEDEPEWVEVIVDLLLSLLSRNNHLLRSLGKCVFPHLCPELTSSSIHQILAVLDPKDERGPLVNKNFEEDDEDDDDDDDSDNDSQSDDTDEDEDNDNEAEEEEEDDDDDENQATSDDDDNVDEEEDDESDEDEDDDDDDYDDEDETVTDRLKEALHQVLGASAQTDNDDNDDIDIDEIDEEEGKRLDAKLSAAFKILRQNRRNQKKKQKKTAEALTHFRVRVIDLLEIYIDCGPSMAIALDMLVPLFALLEFSIKDQHQKPLENRVRSCLKKLSNVKKFKDHNGVDETLISDMAKLLILKGERSTSICQEMGDKLAQCCTFLIRCTQQAGLPPSTLVDIYSENLTSFFKKRDCILSAVLFRSALQLSWTGTWQLIPSIIDFAFDNTTRSFRRGQALDLLTVFYHNHRMITSEEHQSLREKLEVKLYNYSLNWFKEFNESQLSTNDDKKNACIGKEARQKFVCLLWTLLKAVHSRHIKKAWNWKKIGDAMVEYRKQVSLSNDAKSAYNKLAQAIGAPINIKTIIKNPTTTPTPAAAAVAVKTTENGDATVNDKDNESDDEDDVDDKKKNKKNHKNKNDAKKQKKEAKQLRAKAMAKGFEDVHFVDLDILNGGNDNDDADDDKQEENMEIQNGNNDNNETENIIDESNDDTSSKKRKSITSSDDTPVKTKKKKKTQK